MTDKQLLSWERDGYLVTRKLLDPSAVALAKRDVEAAVESRMLEALRHRIRVLCPSADPLASTTPDQARKTLAARGAQVGFLQFFNLHRTCPSVRALAAGPALAGAAAALLGVRRVRLFQDAVFLKEPGFDVTNWHSDLRMTRLDANAYCTAWVPLRAVAGGGRDSGLQFAAGSHRDFALAYWHDVGRYGDLGDRGYRVGSTGAMEVGDASWHHGWLLHCAGAQPQGSRPRLALAVSYFADGARLLDERGDPSVR